MVSESCQGDFIQDDRLIGGWLDKEDKEKVKARKIQNMMNSYFDIR